MPRLYVLLTPQTGVAYDSRCTPLSGVDRFSWLAFCQWAVVGAMIALWRFRHVQEPRPFAFTVTDHLSCFAAYLSSGTFPPPSP